MSTKRMTRITIYLTDADIQRLQRLAEREGISRSAIIREALAAYERASAPDRNFALADSWQGDGTSVADIPEEELLRGFGSWEPPEPPPVPQ